MRVSNPTHYLSQLTVDDDLDFLGLYQVKNLAAPASGEALRKGQSDVIDAEIPAAIARDTEVTAAVADEATARDAAIDTHKGDASAHHTKYTNAEAVAAVGGRFTMVRKTADQTVNNSAILQNDDQLLFAIGANEVWEFSFILLATSGTTPDMQVAVTMPSGGDVDWFWVGPNSAGTLVEIVVNGSAGSTNMEAKDNPTVIIIRGIAVNSTNAGNVQLQWAQNTANATDTKVLTNSCLIAHKLA